MIRLFFGGSFLPSLSPTRIMLLTSLLEVLQQILIQPLVSSGQLRRYALLINGGTLVAAVVGWRLVPGLGLFGFLVAKYLAALLPLLPLLFLSWKLFEEPKKLMAPLTISLALSGYVLSAGMVSLPLPYERSLFVGAMLLLVICGRQDALSVFPSGKSGSS
ncbi:MAG: hypothetical protein ACK6AD_07490 [Cyanobacteriota bacterium]